MSKKQVFNPYLPSFEYVPDGEPRVFGDRLYIFGSHDQFAGKRYCANDYVCWSTPVHDLTAWECHGISYTRKLDPDCPNNEFEMYAPDVVQGPDGRFYMYYGLSFRQGIKVAVSDKPEGPYAFYGSVRYPDGTKYGFRKKEVFRFDPAVLVDDDGSVYLYTGFCPAKKLMHIVGRMLGIYLNNLGNMVVKLDKDMLTVISEPKYMLPGAGSSKGTGFEGHEFYEASSIRKYNGKYYAIYSSVLSHELAHAVSDYPDRDFRYAGPLHSNGNIGFNGQEEPTYYWGNNHGSVELVEGRYYVFGQRPTHQDEYSRQGIAEPITMKPDGTFAMAEMTSCGLNGSPLRSEGSYEAGIACVLCSNSGAGKTTLTPKQKPLHPFITQDGEDRESDPAQYIANMKHGSVAGFKYFCAEQDTVHVSVSWTSSDAQGKLEVFTDAALQNKAGSFEISHGGGTTEPLEVMVSKEKYALYFRYVGTGSMELRQLSFR